MRRVLAVVALGGVLLAGAACGSKSDDTATPPTAAATGATTPAVALPSAASGGSGKAAKEICDAIDPDKNKGIEEFGKQYGVMLGLRMSGAASKDVDDATQKAKLQLMAVAVEFRQLAGQAADEKLREALLSSAMRMEASSADPKFFTSAKTEKDLESVFTTAIVGWFTPVMTHCA